ncbi:MAG: hypothetical protein HY284_01940 [Nitrospirae bacterium]|nr:hypothetical protein [Nitrospirota bacterium]
MVTFETFWDRLQRELKEGKEIEGKWFWKIPKWSVAERVHGDIILLYEGKNVITFQTGRDNVRPVHKGEFGRVYEHWDDYKKDRIGRSFFVKELKIPNMTWIIPVLKHFEKLMD